MGALALIPAVVSTKPGSTATIVPFDRAAPVMAVQWKVDRSPGTIGEAEFAVQKLLTGSLRFRSDVRDCEAGSEGLGACLARSLDDYADWLEDVPRTARSILPEAIPAIRRAAGDVGRAATPAEARAALAAATGTIRKSIELVSATDGNAFDRLERAQRNVLLGSLAAADEVLVRAVGL